MRKFVVAFVAAMLLGGASASELPFQGEFVLMVDGVVVGTGELNDRKLEIKLAYGTIGFDGVLVVFGEDGLLVEYEVSVGADGSVMMWESLIDLNRAVTDAGGEVEVDFDLEATDVENAEEDLDEAAEDRIEAAEDAAEALEEASERAAEEAQDALERAAEQAERDAEAAEDAAEKAAEDAEDAAERAADEREEAGEDEESEDEDEESEDEDEESEDEDEESDDEDGEA